VSDPPTSVGGGTGSCECEESLSLGPLCGGAAVAGGGPGGTAPASEYV
jgi:hypothetical protein